jgi:hypothetical protein
MASSGILRCVALVRTDVSEELCASFIRVTRISELGTTLTVTSNRRTLRRNTSITRVTRIGELGPKLAVTSNGVFLRSVRRLLVTTSVVPSSPIHFTLISVLTKATRRNIPEDVILYFLFIYGTYYCLIAKECDNISKLF